MVYFFEKKQQKNMYKYKLYKLGFKTERSQHNVMMEF